MQIIDDSMYECQNCKAVVAGRYLDWFEDDIKEELLICPICGDRCKFIMIEGKAKPESRRVVISDDNGDVLWDFVVSKTDAVKISDNFSTDWMDEAELEEYLRDDK